jgi:hypothetical protein
VSEADYKLATFFEIGAGDLCCFVGKYRETLYATAEEAASARHSLKTAHEMINPESVFLVLSTQWGAVQVLSENRVGWLYKNNINRLLKVFKRVSGGC